MGNAIRVDGVRLVDGADNVIVNKKCQRVRVPVDLIQGSMPSKTLNPVGCDWSCA